MKLIFTALLTILVSSCGQNDKKLKERSETEEKSKLSVENENLAKKADLMEKDLTRRHRFYQAIKGIYEGTISNNLGTFNIRITLNPSLAPLNTTRIRQLEEIAADLNNLTLSTQIVQWDSNNVNSAVGCRISSVRPDIEKGEFAISSESCSNIYIIKITERGFIGEASETVKMASLLSKQVLNGDLKEIDSVVGTIQPSTNASIFKFVAHKVQE